MYPNLNGFNTKEITLYTEENVKPGMPVMLTENYSAILPAAGSRFIGICTSVRGNYISVAVTGVVTAPFTGSGLNIGYAKVSPDGNGKIKSDSTSGTEILVLEVNEYEKLVTFILK